MASLVERNEAGLVDTSRCRGQPRRRGHDYGSRLSACPARLRMRGLCGRGGTQALSQVPSSRASFWRDSEQSRNTQPVSRQRGSSHEHGEVARASDGSGRRGGLRAARRHPCGLPGCYRGREERKRHHASRTDRRLADGDPSGAHDLHDPFLEHGRSRNVSVLDDGGGCVHSDEEHFLEHRRDIARDIGRGTRGREHVHVLCAVPRPLPEREPGRLPNPVLCTIRGRLRYSIRECVRYVDACRRGVRSLVLRARRDLDVRSEPES